MNAKTAVEENQDVVNSAEEIIELRDLRMSPIPSLRNRHKAKYYKEPGGTVGKAFIKRTFQTKHIPLSKS